ncbi:cytochrome-c peroxidase [Microseira sp. BLCC-F43]|jgi:cytochrome c peroxidase|uniref:cytochrome-c peroxidase n=1 Tax=Microseira sp. BLCC-F43 TaxID=3153602 RepID=UPI0035B80315
MLFYFNQRLIRRFSIILVAIVPMAIAIAFWQQTYHRQEPQIETADNRVTQVSTVNEPIQPIESVVQQDKTKVALGDTLFHEPQLSHTNTISCASCHNLSTGGVDRLVRSIGVNGVINSVNSPTVFNSGFNFRQDWDGGAETLEEHLDSAIKNPQRMASSWAEIIGKLKRSPYYVRVFNQIYKDGITSDNVIDALATFERSLITPNSRFDKFLRGDVSAINEDEKAGYRRFKTYGCVSCHQGVNLGGNLFQKFGIMGDYFTDRGNITQADFGRFNITGKSEDRYVFKVPNLRNITLTAPYLHDGSAATLESAIAIMAKYQLGRELSKETVDLIVKFLTTLTGEYQGKPL